MADEATQVPPFTHRTEPHSRANVDADISAELVFVFVFVFEVPPIPADVVVVLHVGPENALGQMHTAVV